MGHIFKVLDNSNYINEKEKCLLLVEKMFENDNNKLANIADFKKHFDFIFSATYGNKAFNTFYNRWKVGKYGKFL